MSAHRRTPVTAIHRGPRRLGGLLRSAHKSEPRHRGRRPADEQAARPTHAAPA